MSQRPETGADAVTPQMERFIVRSNGFGMHVSRAGASTGACNIIQSNIPLLEGEWYRAADVASLQAENERLKGRLEKIEAGMRVARASFGHHEGQEACACVFCAEDLDGIWHLTFEYELAKQAAIDRAEAAERRAEALATAIREWKEAQDAWDALPAIVSDDEAPHANQVNHRCDAARAKLRELASK